MKHTLMSCFLQTHADIEIIVVDDGSVDDVEHIVFEFAVGLGMRSKVEVFRQGHQGGNAARNRGVKESRGEFIQFLDSDDLLHPDKLETLLKVLRSQPDLDMAYGLDQYFRHVPGDMSELWNRPNSVSDLDRFLADDPVWHTASPLWRRSTVQRLGDWNPSIVCWQDWEYHILALCKGIKYAHVSTVLQFIRDHDELRSTNLDRLLQREESKLKAGTVVLENLKQHDAFTPLRGNLLAIYFIGLAVDAIASDHEKLFHDCLKQGYRSGSMFFKIVVLSMPALFSTRFGVKLGTAIFKGLKHYLFFRIAGYDQRPTWKTICLPGISITTDLSRKTQSLTSHNHEASRST